MRGTRGSSTWLPLLVVAPVLGSCSPGSGGAATAPPTTVEVATTPSEASSSTGSPTDVPLHTPSDVSPRAVSPTPAVSEPAAATSTQSIGGSSPAPASPRVPATARGAYEYDVEASGRAGAFPRQESRYTVRSVVDPVDANGQQRTTSTTTSDDGEAGEPSEQTLVHSETDIRLVHLRPPQGQGGGMSPEFRPEPPVLLVTTAAAPGTSWSWSMTSTDGDIEVDATIEVVRVETISVGDVDVRTLVVVSKLEFRGDGFEGTEESTTWFAPDHRLTVREESTMVGSGTFNGQQFTFETDETRVLRSLLPT